MSNMNKTKIAQEIGNQIRFYVYRIPKKNHDKMVQNQKEFTDAFRKEGGDYKSFQLKSTVVPEGFTNITTLLSANPDEEVWMDLELYRDSNHMDVVTSKLMDDKSALSLMKQYLALLSPGSSPIRAEFRHFDS
jgi:hypothetical protein